MNNNNNNMNNNIKRSNTVLVVLRDKGRKGSKGELVFGADRRISWGHMRYQKSIRPKITKRHGLIFAGTGASYLCDLVGELADVPDLKKDVDNFLYMHNYFYPSLKNILREKGYMDNTDSVKLPEDFSSTVLVGIRGDLFEVGLNSEGISIDAIDSPFCDGCGGYYAQGSLHATEGLSLDVLNKQLKHYGVKDKRDNETEARIILSILAASDNSSGCDSNIDIVRESDNDE